MQVSFLVCMANTWLTESSPQALVQFFSILSGQKVNLGIRIWLRFSQLQAELSSLVSPGPFPMPVGDFFAWKAKGFRSAGIILKPNVAPHLPVCTSALRIQCPSSWAGLLSSLRGTDGHVRVRFIHLDFIWGRKLSKDTCKSSEKENCSISRTLKAA